MDKVWEYLVENPYWFAIIAVVIAAIVVALVLLLSVHKIKYYSCGGKAVPAFRARRGALVIMPKPEREGYIFGGWYFDPAYTRIAIIATMPRQSVKVYAKWMRPLAPQEGSDGKPITFLPTSEESAPVQQGRVRRALCILARIQGRSPALHAQGSALPRKQRRSRPRGDERQHAQSVLRARSAGV